MSSEMGFQDGLGASAFFERQTPPPAAPTYSVHVCGLHFGSTVSAVTRPDHCVGRRYVCVPRRSTFSVSGPSDCHFEFIFAPCPFTFFASAIARWVCANVIASAGYARLE